MLCFKKAKALETASNAFAFIYFSSSFAKLIVLLN